MNQRSYKVGATAAIVVAALAIGFSLQRAPGAAPAPPPRSSPASAVPIAQPSPSPGLSASASPSETPTADDERVMQSLVEFARRPGPGSFAAVPLASTVRLGLSYRLHIERAARDLVLPGLWVLQVDAFRGYVGPFSALDLLARNVPTTVLVGPHSHCASPPVPAPAEVLNSRRVSIQPKDVGSCLSWWTVDLFLSSAGEIEAVTLDLWDP